MGSRGGEIAWLLSEAGREKLNSETVSVAPGLGKRGHTGDVVSPPPLPQGAVFPLFLLAAAATRLGAWTSLRPCLIDPSLSAPPPQAWASVLTTPESIRTFKIFLFRCS